VEILLLFFCIFHAGVFTVVNDCDILHGNKHFSNSLKANVAKNKISFQ